MCWGEEFLPPRLPLYDFDGVDRILRVEAQVAHRGLQALVSKERLDSSHRHPLPVQLGRKRMPQLVRGHTDRHRPPTLEDVL